jgi:molybdopterin synthase catalytic subunit
MIRVEEKKLVVEGWEEFCASGAWYRRVFAWALRPRPRECQCHTMSEIHCDSTNSSTDVLDPSKFPQVLTSEDGNCVVSLTYHRISSETVLQSIRSPAAGANVLFLGTTRDSFDGRAVSRLSYSAYPALALKSFLSIAEAAHARFGLQKVSIVHRLGVVEVEEESIAVAVSAAHRGPAWEGAEDILERCKERVEVWKMEEFKGEQGTGEWRANKDRDSTGKVAAS